MRLTPQQELFAQHVASGLNQSEAYRRAYPKSANAKSKSVAEMASQLAAKVNVSSRIEELKLVAAKNACLSIEKVLRDIERVRRTAENAGDLKAALKASELQGKHLKMWTDKVDVGGQQDNPLAISVRFVDA